MKKICEHMIDVKILGVFKDIDNATGLRNQLQKDYYNYEGWDINIETLETDLV